MSTNVKEGHTIRQDLDDLLHLLLETDFQDSISLINDKRLDVLEDESFRVLSLASYLSSSRGAYLEMIEQSPWGGHDQINSLCQFIRLCLPVCSSHQYTECLRMTLHQFLCNSEDLQRQFSSGGDDDNSGSYLSAFIPQ